MLLELARPHEALANYDRLIAAQPHHADAHNNRGGILFQLGRTQEALAAFDAALGYQPDHASALLNRSTALTKLNRHAEAGLCYQRLLALNPDNATALGGLADVALHLCDFPAQARLAAPIRALIEAGEPVMQSLNLMAWFDDARLHRRATENQLRRWMPQTPPPLARPPYRHDKIRIAYLSPDFGHHPVAQQMVEVLERHDREPLRGDRDRTSAAMTAARSAPASCAPAIIFTTPAAKAMRRWPRCCARARSTSPSTWPAIPTRRGPPFSATAPPRCR